MCGAGPTTSKLVLGGVLLSHTLAGAVPSALSGLASGFGMEYRAFPCRYDHRDDCTGSAPSSSGAVIRLSVWPPLATRTHAPAWYARGLVAGLGVDRIVDARVLAVSLTPWVTSPCKDGLCGG